MKRQNKCTSDTSLVHLPLRKKLFDEIQKYLADYDIYLKEWIKMDVYDYYIPKEAVSNKKGKE